MTSDYTAWLKLVDEEGLHVVNQQTVALLLEVVNPTWWIVPLSCYYSMLPEDKKLDTAGDLLFPW